MAVWPAVAAAQEGRLGPRILPARVLDGGEEGTGEGGTGEGGTHLPEAGRREVRLFRTGVGHLEAGRAGEAVVYFQNILDAEADGFIEEGGRLVSLRVAVGRRLDGLTGEAKQAYELRYGATAKGLLEEAVRAGDGERLAEVGRRFGATEAGREAALRLAAAHLDRGEALAAVGRLERLRGAVSSGRRPGLLLRLALCYARLGDAGRRDAVVTELGKLGGEVQVGGRTIAAADREAVRKALAELAGGSAAGAAEWPGGGGDAGRTGYRPAAEGARAEWSVVSLTDPFFPPGGGESPTTKLLHRWASQTGLGEMAAGRPGVPTARPVAAGGMVFVRTPANLTALDAADGSVRWRTLADPLCWDYLNGRAAETPDGDAACRAFVGQRIWSDATWGTVATDGRVVFAVEETGAADPLPPVPGAESHEAAPQVVLPPAFNRLAAYDAATGGRVWETGGPPDGGGLLAGAYFLGPPVPAGGRWYALAEVGGGTRLVGFDPNRPEEAPWMQPVAAHDVSIDRDRVRRTAGLSPTVAGGLLVCPVGPGAVVAVDPAERSLLWAHVEAPAEGGGPARPVPVPLPIQGPFDVEPARVPPEVVAAGSVVLLAGSRAGTLTAVDPLDGAVRWTAEVGPFLWLIGADAATAYVQAAAGVVAVRLADGRPAWDTPAAIGEPSGRGVVVGGRVYVPLADATLAVIDAGTGKVVETRPVPGDEALGNLIVVGGSLVGQSAMRVVGVGVGK